MENKSGSDFSRYGNLEADTAVSTALQKKAQKLIKELIDKKDAVGIQVYVSQKGNPVLDITGGILGIFDPRPVEKDTLFPVFSCTKAVAATMLHKLVEEGKLSYDDPVHKHWPDFVNKVTDDESRERKKRVLVSHVLSHQAGLHEAGGHLLQEEPYAIADWNKMMGVMEEAVPTLEPGEATIYHSLSYGWLVGGLIEKVSGQAFSEVFLKCREDMRFESQGYIGVPVGIEPRLATVHLDVKELFDRLGFDNVEGTLDLADSKALKDRAPPNMRAMKLNPMAANPSFFNQLKIRRGVIPAANGHFTAKGLASVYEHLLEAFHDNGTLAAKYLTKDTIVKMSQPQGYLSGQMAFALGYRVYNFKQNDFQSTGFGHAGLGGSIALCDLDHHVAISIVVNRLSLVKPKATHALLQLISDELGLGTLVQIGESNVDMNPVQSSG